MFCTALIIATPAISTRGSLLFEYRGAIGRGLRGRVSTRPKGLHGGAASYSGAHGLEASCFFWVVATTTFWLLFSFDDRLEVAVHLLTLLATIYATYPLRVLRFHTVTARTAVAISAKASVMQQQRSLSWALTSRRPRQRTHSLRRT